MSNLATDPDAETAAALQGLVVGHGGATAKPRVQRIEALDGLRAVAFISVFLFHLGNIRGYSTGWVSVYNELNNWGFLGVDLFFVISGYIITRLLLQEQSVSGKIDIKKFFQRRILRVWPMFYLALAVSAAGTLLFAKRNFDSNLYNYVLSSAYLPLSFFWYLMPPVVTDAIARLTEQCRFPVYHSLAPMWSICVEEQFYLLWPWCVAFVKDRRRLLLCLGLMVLIAEFCRATNYPDIPGFFYSNPISRVTPLAVGIFIAISEFADSRAYRAVKANSMVLLCLACSLASLILFGPMHGQGVKLTSSFPYYPLVTIAIGGALLACLENPFCKRILSAESLKAIGRYSYSMYLFHYPLMFVTRPTHWTMIDNSLFLYIVWGVISFALTLCVGKFTWIGIEKPLSAMRSRLST